MIIYEIQIDINKIDEKLLKASFGQSIQYVSFKHITLDVRIGYSYANNYKNMKVRFKILNNINMKAIVTEKQSNKYMFLKDYLLSIENDGR